MATFVQTLKRRVKIAAISVLGFLIPSACMFTPTTCYEPVMPTCYLPPDRTDMPTSTPTPSTSPLSPLPTPSPTPEARGRLRERLLTENRFPAQITEELEN